MQPALAIQPERSKNDLEHFPKSQSQREDDFRFGESMQQYQQQRSYGDYNMAPQQRSGQQQQQSGQQYYMNGIRPRDSGNSGGGGGAQQGGPLEKKVMVLYVQPGDPVSMQAYQMVVDYPEILVQNASQINPRPAWLTGVPTAVRVEDRSVFVGPQAFQILAMYINRLKAMSGAQDNMVVPTLDNMRAFSVADKNLHGRAAIEERTTDVPVGQTAHAMSVGRVNFQSGEDMRYYQQGKVSEGDVAAYTALRGQQRQRPVQWMPSVLEDGSMVNM